MTFGRRQPALRELALRWQSPPPSSTYHCLFSLSILHLHLPPLRRDLTPFLLSVQIRLRPSDGEVEKEMATYHCLFLSLFSTSTFLLSAAAQGEPAAAALSDDPASPCRRPRPPFPRLPRRHPLFAIQFGSAPPLLFPQKFSKFSDLAAIDLPPPLSSSISLSNRPICLISLCRRSSQATADTDATSTPPPATSPPAITQAAAAVVVLSSTAGDGSRWRLRSELVLMIPLKLADVVGRGGHLPLKLADVVGHGGHRVEDGAAGDGHGSGGGKLGRRRRRAALPPRSLRLARRLLRRHQGKEEDANKTQSAMMSLRESPPPSPLLDLEALQPLSVLGRGAKCVVFTIHDHRDDAYLALKAISRSSVHDKGSSTAAAADDDDYRRVWFERDVLLALHHPLLPTLRGSCSARIAEEREMALSARRKAP